MSNRNRLHPAFIVMNVLSSLREMFVPLLFLVITALRSGSFEWWNLIGICAILFFTVVSSLFRWFRFYYVVADREIRIEYGLFVRKQRFIPFERIQSIHVTQGVIHRLFGLVKLQIETAGGSIEPEAQLSALTKKKGEALREWIRKQEDVSEEQTEAKLLEEVEYESKLSKKALLIVASTSGGFGVLFSFIAAVFSQIGEFLPEQFYENIYGMLISSSIVFISVIIFVIAFVAWIVSMMSTLLRFGGFTLKKKRNEIIIERGLLEKRQLTVPINKVQAVRIDEGLLRQPFRYATLSIEVAGDSGQDQDQSTLIHPLIKKNEVYPFLKNVLPTFAEDVSFQTVPKRSRRRYVFRNTWFFVLLVCMAFWFIPMQYAIPTIALIIIGIFFGVLKHKDAGWFLTNELVAVQFRRLKRTTVFTLKKRIQAFEYAQSPFQKRKQLVSFQISVLGGLFGNTYTVADMDEKKADELFHQLRSRKRLT